MAFIATETLTIMTFSELEQQKLLESEKKVTKTEKGGIAISCKTHRQHTRTQNIVNVHEPYPLSNDFVA